MEQESASIFVSVNADQINNNNLQKYNPYKVDCNHILSDSRS